MVLMEQRHSDPHVEFRPVHVMVLPVNPLGVFPKGFNFLVPCSVHQFISPENKLSTGLRTYVHILLSMQIMMHENSGTSCIAQRRQFAVWAGVQTRRRELVLVWVA